MDGQNTPTLESISWHAPVHGKHGERGRVVEGFDVVGDREERGEDRIEEGGEER